MASAPTSPEATTLGPYRLLRRLSVGGMAEVFEARDLRDDSRWAVKIPLPSASREPAYVEALEHEAALAVRLRHPNLVQGRELVRDGDRIGFVMECVDGLPLDQLFESSLDARPGPRVALVAVESLLEALATAHEATGEDGRPLHVVHRDVKPSNVFVARDGTVKLLDFGIARSSAQANRTRTGAIKGTLRYLTPEQATGSALDPRTDLYAVALLAYEWVTGAPYLDASSDLELLRLAEDPPPKPWPESLPAAARSTLGRCLGRFPEDRPSSARAVARALAHTDDDRTAARAALAAWVGALAPSAPSDPRLEALGRATTAPEAPHPGAGRVGAARAQVDRGRLAGVALVAAALAGGAFAFMRAEGGRSVTAPPPRAPHAARPDAPGVPAPTTSSSAETAPAPGEQPARAEAPRAAPASAPPVPPAAGVRGVVRSAAPPRGLPSAAPRGPSGATTSSPPEPPVDGTRPAPLPSGEPVAPAAPAVTRESVRRRLASADAAMQRARARGDDVGALERDARLALEHYAEGDYEGADRLLTRLLRALPD